jgi:hypothetical protein
MFLFSIDLSECDASHSCYGVLHEHLSNKAASAPVRMTGWSHKFNAFGVTGTRSAVPNINSRILPVVLTNSSTCLMLCRIGGTVSTYQSKAAILVHSRAFLKHSVFLRAFGGVCDDVYALSSV